MSYRWIVGMLVLGAVTAALISGCGDDEASADVTKAEFTKEAEAVCAERKKEWKAAVSTFLKEAETNKGASSEEQQKQANAFFSDSVLPIVQAELEGLEDLDVPEADQAKVEKMLQSRSKGLEELEEKGSEALFGGSFEAFEKEAKAYGIDCALE